MESNPALQQILGYNREELRSMVFTKFTHADDVKATWELAQELFAGKRDRFWIEKRYIRKDGEVVWGHATGSLVRGARGEPQFVIGMVEDITERKRAEEALSNAYEDSLRRQEAVLNLAEDLRNEVAERKQAEEAVRRHLERVEALREIDRAITSTLDLPRVLDIILEELERVIPYHSASIFLLSDDTAKLTAGRGFPDMERVLQVSFAVKEDPLTRELMQEKHPLVLADAQADERFLARGDTEYVRSWIGVPLIAKGKAVGFLSVDHRQAGVYDQESAEIAQTFASQAAIAIENARLFDQTRRRVAELTALQQVGMKLASSLDLPSVLNSIADSTLELTQADYVHIFTLDPQTGEFMQRAASWSPEAKPPPNDLAQRERVDRHCG